MSEGRKAFLEGLKKAERRKGTVSSIVNFGVFVDLGGGVDGLVHVSELSWKHVDHPSEVVSVGQEVEVEVLDVDLERERVSLSLKATQEDPWREFERMYQAGEVISGQVTKLVPFGAFVRVGEGIEGLVHISELANEHIESPDQVVNVGDQVRVKVVDVDVPRRRISLSIKRVADTPEALPEPEFEAETAEDVVAEATPELPAEAEPVLADADAPARSAQEALGVVVEPQLEEPEEVAASAAPAEDAPAEPAVPVPDEAPAEAPADAPADASEDAESDEDISLEAILEDLKRREGRD
jgi:small subunit ribosomal protein S1